MQNQFNSRNAPIVSIARIKGEVVYYNLLSDIGNWIGASEADQYAVIKYIDSKLGEGFNLSNVESNLYQEKPTCRIATFCHLQTGLELNLIPGGRYLQGTAEGSDFEVVANELRERHSLIEETEELICPDEIESEQPQHLSTIPPFLLSRCPVSQRMWDTFDFLDYRQFSQNSLPIEGVPRQSALDWLKATHPDFRLPSESEWEYACRAGSNTHWSHGNSVKEHDSFAWHGFNAPRSNFDLPALQKSGLKEPNHFGLFDMHGNVSEWCADYYLPSYEGTIKNEAPRLEHRNPKYPKGVVRGGSFLSPPQDQRSAYRESVLFGVGVTNFDGVGFRVAMSLPEFQTDKK